MTLTQWRGAMPKYKLAEILGVSIRHYYRWEDGSAPIPHYLRLLMATAQPGELKIASEAIRSALDPAPAPRPGGTAPGAF